MVYDCNINRTYEIKVKTERKVKTVIPYLLYKENGTTACHGHAELDIQGECVSPVLSLQNTLLCEIG